MLTGTITKEKWGALTVHCYHGNNCSIIPLDLDQWEDVKKSNLIGKQVYVKEIMKGGGFVAHALLTHSDSIGAHISREDAEELMRQAFYDGREIVGMNGKTPIFKHQTFNGWLREKEQKLQKGPKENLED